MMLKILILISTFSLGVFLGTQLAEAVLVVPYWKNMPPQVFFEFYKEYGGKLHEFYAPLTIFSTLLPLATLGYCLVARHKVDWLLWLMVTFSILFFSTFFLYFKEANLSFTERTITDEALPQELMKWAKWHWARVVCELIAFVCGLLLLLKSNK